MKAIVGLGSSRKRSLVTLVGCCLWLLPRHAGSADGEPATVLTGRDAFSDYRRQAPGVTRKITVADLPAPNASRSADNGPELVPRPKNAWPKAPAGFTVDLYANGLENPRLLRRAPNGDVFLAESRAGKIKVLRPRSRDGLPVVHTFATGARRPFGMAFYPPGDDPRWLYVGNTDAVVRYPYRNGDLVAKGKAEHIADLPGGGQLRGGGHWTRDVAFSLDGKTMFVSVGSRTNNDDPDENPDEKDRAAILAFAPDGSGRRVFASGLRNAVGIAVDRRNGVLWASVNERDGLGDDLPPDYITRVREGAFYGWPWYYIGGHPDPRHRGKHPELAKKVVVPDVLLQPHLASLQLAFYEGAQFPEEYRGDIFAAEHGSWNRAVRTGYEVIRVPRHGKAEASGEYQDFLTGFVTPDGKVWGRPVGVAVDREGSLLVSDDGSGAVWRVRYVGRR